MNKKTNTQAISAGHEVTLEAAEIILRNGGNAFDATVAAGITMFLSEPCMASAGAGGFASIFTAEKETYILDFFTQTPINKIDTDRLDFYPIQVDFGNELETFHVGMGSIATPGMIAGLFELHQKFGSMPMHEILQVPMQFAKSGVPLNTFQRLDLGLLEPIFNQDKSMSNVFFKEGKLKNESDIIQMPRLPDFIQLLMDEGSDGFYRGDISAIIDRDSRDRGGHLRRTDLENYKPFWRKPLQYHIKDYILQVPPAPSLGGAIQLLLLDCLEKNNGQWIPSIKQIKNKYPSWSPIRDAMQLLFSDQAFLPDPNQIASKGTSHFNICDKWGNAVGFTCSIGEGSGYFVPGTDMHMNNMLGEDFLLEKGFHSWAENSRLHSMMCPTLVTNASGDLSLIAGSGGASRIPFVIAQVAHRFIHQNSNLQELIEFPRAVIQENIIHIEKNFDQSFDQEEYELKEWDYSSLFFGGVHAIAQYPNGEIQAEGDRRRYGVAKTWT